MTTMTHKLALLVSGLLLFLATGIGAADSATQDEKARVRELQHARATLAHWFSMMSALATDRLM